MRITKVLSSVAVLAIAGGAAGFVVSDGHDLQAGQSMTEAPLVSAKGGRVSLVCTGGVARTIDMGVNAAHVDEDISGSAGLLATGDEGEWIPANADSDLDAIPVTGRVDPTTTSELGIPDMRGTAIVPGDSSEDAVFAGGSIHRATAGDLRGLAVNPCIWSDSTVWLVGSSGAVGTSNRMLLANPGLTSVTVSIEAFSSLGPVDLGSRQNVVLAPLAQEEILLDGIIGTDERIAFRLSADSGRFGAALQTTSLNGFTPAGVSFVSAADSGTTVTVPGVVVAAAESDESLLADPNQEVRLRIVNPSEQPATVHVQTRHSTSVEDLPGGSDVDVVAGGVLDLTLEGLSPDTYDVIVTSDSDITAGVLMTRTSSAGTDSAWAAAQRPIRNGGAIIEGSAQLSLSGTAQVDWKAYSADGAVVAEGSESVAGATRAVALPEARFVTIDADAPVHAAVLSEVQVSDGRGIEWIPVVTHGSATRAIRVATTN